MEQVHLKISGRVQGVFFRANTQREAAKLALKGWVRNTPDGGVEALAQGSREKLEAFVAFCRRGPENARVDGIDIRWEPATEMFSGFHVRY